jgi:hypothetical protein
MARTIVIAALTLLLGIFVGGLAPRAELARARAELAEAEARGKRSGAASALPLALGLGSLAAARGMADERAREGTSAQAGARRVPQFVPGAAGSAGDGPASDESEGRQARREQRFAAARTAAEVRAAQFRSAFVDQAQLTPAGQAALDATITGMNTELGRAADEIVASLTAKQANHEKVSPRDFADVGARVLDIYRRADDQFKAGLDQNGKTAMAKTDFDLLTQIDLGKFEQLGATLQTIGGDGGFSAGVPGAGRAPSAPAASPGTPGAP